jgi:hypothetical protein
MIYFAFKTIKNAFPWNRIKSIFQVDNFDDLDTNIVYTFYGKNIRKYYKIRTKKEIVTTYD